MKIGVISDTHIPNAARELPRSIYEHFKGVDLIVHAGDFVDLKVLEDLKSIQSRVIAVHGNMDPQEVRKCLPAKQVIEIDGFHLGLIHGSGAPSGLVDAVKREFEDVDVIVFGHSHSPLNEVKDGVLFFNPGSPTDKVFAPCNSVGILYVDKKIRGEIIRLE